MLRGALAGGLAIALSLVSGPAAAQSVNADGFYRRAVALKSKGPLALFNAGQIRALTAQGKAAGAAAGARYDADRKAGRPTRFCPPPGPRTMGSSEFLKRLGQIPAAERVRIDLTEATTRILVRKFPCHGRR